MNVIIHLYRNRSYRSETVTQVCDGQRKSFGYGRLAGFTTVHANATCAKCLDTVLPKAEAALAKMKANRALNLIETEEVKPESRGFADPVHVETVL